MEPGEAHAYLGDGGRATVAAPSPTPLQAVSRTERRTHPTTLVALALIAGGAFFLVRGRGDAETCDPGAGLACAPGTRPADLALGTASRGADPAGPPRLTAAEACRGVSYLCAELDTAEEIHLYRWRSFEGVMVVHVPLPDIPDRAQAYALRSAATAGIRLWNGQPFPILVDERGTRNANIEVHWVPSLGGSQIGVARTVWSPADGLSVRSLELVTRSPHGGRPLDPREVRLTAAHEMGHALGLPHSDDPRDLMYPANTATSLTAGDYRALEALYDFEDGTVIVR